MLPPTIPTRTIRRGDVLVYWARPQRRRWSLASVLPREILIVEGLAIAVYANDAVVQYATLDDLIADHGLVMSDLTLGC